MNLIFFQLNFFTICICDCKDTVFLWNSLTFLCFLFDKKGENNYSSLLFPFQSGSICVQTSVFI